MLWLTLVEQLSEEDFRLKMRPLAFMTLSIQPTVDLRVGRIQRNHSFTVSSFVKSLSRVYRPALALNLKGYLSPWQTNCGTRLIGKS